MNPTDKKETVLMKMQKNWQALSLICAILLAGWGAATAWSENDTKVTSLEKRIALVEDTQNEQAKLANKMFDYTMQLWGIDPKAAKKWKTVPMSKPDSVMCEYEWTEFEGFDLWIHYKYTCDSVGVPSLLVDTLHVVKKKD